MSDTVYTIHIVNWDKFQHGSRQNPWIKNYLSQLHKHEYMTLSFHLRGILHGLRLEYAASGRQLTHSTATLSRQLGHRVMTRDLKALSDAGFITLDASNVLAQSREEKSREEKPPVVPLASEGDSSPAASTRSTSLEPVNGHASPAGAQQLVAHFIDRSRTLGSQPPGRVKGQVARLVGELVAEGETPERIAAGIDLMLERRLHPATLPSCVHEAGLPRPKPSGPRPFHVADRLLADLRERQAQ